MNQTTVIAENTQRFNRAANADVIVDISKKKVIIPDVRRQDLFRRDEPTNTDQQLRRHQQPGVLVNLIKPYKCGDGYKWIIQPLYTVDSYRIVVEKQFEIQPPNEENFLLYNLKSLKAKIRSIETLWDREIYNYLPTVRVNFNDSGYELHYKFDIPKREGIDINTFLELKSDGPGIDLVEDLAEQLTPVRLF